MGSPNKKDWITNLCHRIMQAVLSVFSRLSKLFDRVVYSPKSSLVVSLLASIAICISINFNDLNYRFFNKDEEVLNLSNVPVNAIYNTEEYTVNGIPETVNVTLTGSPADIQLYRTQYQVEVNADLRNLSVGKNVVALRAGGFPSQINASVNPAEAEVTIQKKMTRNYTVSAELIVGAGQSLDEFKVKSLSQTSVMIQATKAELDSIRIVKALVDTSGQNKNFSQEASLVAYDSSGNRVNVTIIPDTVTVEVEYTEPKEDAGSDSENKHEDSNAAESSSQTN